MEIDWLKQWSLYSPQNIALKDGDTGESCTYQDFFAHANRYAHILKTDYAVQPGDRVAIVAQNELQYIYLFFAVQRLGAILVPINFRLTGREFNHIIEDSQAKVVFHQPAFKHLIDQVPENTKPQHSLDLLDFHQTSTKLKLVADVPMTGDFKTPVMILYTSGTTGAPKGAVLTHEMLFWNSINGTLRLNINQSDCAVIFLPLFHTGGWNVLTTPFIHRGAKIVLLKKFEAEKIISLCESEQSTILFGVPTTMDMLARAQNFAAADLSRIRYAIVGGEPMPLPLIETWHQKHIPIRQGYGLTEFGPNVFSLNEQDAIRKMGSIGFPNFYTEAKVIDDKGHQVPDDTIGELVLRGPMCMQSYWKNPKATAETIVDGWLHTGDLVKRDSEGYFFVVGRKKDMYKSGGENVYPTEIEQVLQKIPGVKEVAVIGVPDTKWGEVGKAFLVKEHSSDLSIENVSDHCLKNLAKFKIPKHFVFLPELPKGDSGKILKRKLQEL